MNGLKINCFYHNDLSSQQKELGIDYSILDCDVRPIVFYNIQAISSYIDDGLEYGVIHSNGSEFTTTINFNELEKKIERWR